MPPFFANVREKIPPLYHRLIPDTIHFDVPVERQASCTVCVRCREKDSPFLDTKCCDYHPWMANFLVGGLLASTEKRHAVGQARMRDQIKNRFGINPVGVLRPKEYAERYDTLNARKKTRSKEEADSLLCPFYDHGNCTVWDYREPLCATFFCASVGGPDGISFWSSLRKYLRLIETRLVQFSLKELGFPPEIFTFERLSKVEILSETSASVDEKVYRDVWGEWFGREAELFVAAFRLVESFDRSALSALLGTDGETAVERILDAREPFVNPVIPNRLVFATETQTELDPDSHSRVIKTESECLAVPPFVFDKLPSLDGLLPTVDFLETFGPLNELVKRDFLVPLIRMGVLSEPDGG